MIDVQRLRVLREVVRQGSFNRAATRLRLTPSAVSQQIAALERSLGAAVVHRSTRGVEVTEAGRVLVETGDAIAAELAYAEREIDRLAQVDQEQLTVATFTSGGQRILPEALIRFSGGYPLVELTVLECEPEESLALVRAGDADLALAYHLDRTPPVLPDDRSGLTWTHLIEDPMRVVLPRDHRLAHRESVAMVELAGEIIGHYAALAGVEIRTACRGSDYVFAQALVRAGVGISLVPTIALAQYTDGLAVARLEPPAPSRYIGAAVARRRCSRPLVRALLDALDQTVRAWR
jgi:molybdate transport repressor ModE-like protein